MGRRNSKIRVVVADDHSILRAGLRMLINSERDMEVVGEAAGGNEVEDVLRETTPDVLLLDITMPAGGGLKVLTAVRRLLPQVRVLILTMHEDPAYLRSVLAAGASGYVLKRAVDADLLFAIRAVHRGGTFVDPSLAQNLLPQRGASSKGSLLSPRERQVLQLVAEGYTNQQVADRIFVSVKSVETYRARIAQKLSLKSRADFVRFALESGMLTPQQVADRNQSSIVTLKH
jgi:two-component system, NarL family, response regulator NreC